MSEQTLSVFMALLSVTPVIAMVNTMKNILRCTMVVRFREQHICKEVNI